MAETKKANPVKLLIGIMYANEKILATAIETLKKQFGEFQQGPTINFTFTDYYETETGKNLKKTYIAFNQSIQREQLPAIKLLTNKTEQEYSLIDKRQINIDPGYITETNVILASAKEHPHRIYISDGIYGQIILVYSRNKWNLLEKTFADYQTEEVRNFLAIQRLSLINTSKSL